MPRSEHAARTVAVRLDLVDRPDAITEIVAQVAAAGGSLRTLSTVRRWKDESGDSLIEVELEVEGLPQD
jgi:glycine cleavage system regulatory protein